jgi:hypothetical protein
LWVFRDLRKHMFIRLSTFQLRQNIILKNYGNWFSVTRLQWTFSLMNIFRFNQIIRFIFKIHSGFFYLFSVRWLWKLYFLMWRWSRLFTILIFWIILYFIRGIIGQVTFLRKFSCINWGSYRLTFIFVNCFLIHLYLFYILV